MTVPEELARFTVSHPVHDVWAQMLAAGEIPDRGITLTDRGDLGVLHTCRPGDDGSAHVVDLDAVIAVVFPPPEEAVDEPAP